MKYKYGLIVLFLMILGSGIFFYLIKSQPTIPEGITNLPTLPEGMLIRLTTSAMGAKTITTVSDTGLVTVVSDFLNESTTYTLTADQLQKVNEIVTAEDGQQHIFEPEPGMMYEGTYTLELRYKDSLVRHTSSQPEHENLMQLIRSARPQ